MTCHLKGLVYAGGVLGKLSVQYEDGEQLKTFGLTIGNCPTLAILSDFCLEVHHIFCDIDETKSSVSTPDNHRKLVFGLKFHSVVQKYLQMAKGKDETGIGLITLDNTSKPETLPDYVLKIWAACKAIDTAMSISYVPKLLEYFKENLPKQSSAAEKIKLVKGIQDIKDLPVPFQGPCKIAILAAQPPEIPNFSSGVTNVNIRAGLRTHVSLNSVDNKILATCLPEGTMKAINTFVGVFPSHLKNFCELSFKDTKKASELVSETTLLGCASG